MLDPFPIPPSPWLSKAVQPFADYFSLPTLPLHIHEVIIAFLGYTFINFQVAPVISKWIFPTKYPRLSPDRRMNWDVHVVSLCQSTLITALALWVMFVDEERKHMDWKGRVWGYTGGAGMIQGLAAGYFLWDLMVTIQHIDAFGLGMLAHALCAITVFSFGFRPFLNYYGCTFILYELSSPFLNFHWFFDKLDLTGSRAQLYNGILLLATFFCCRLVWGTYQSIRVYQDVWAAIHHTGPRGDIQMDMMTNTTFGAATGNSTLTNYEDIMLFAGEENVPIWLGCAYLGSNLVLNTLNFFWFGKMIEAVRKRFTPAKASKKKAEVPTSVAINGSSKYDVNETKVRRRKILDEDEPITLT